MHAPPSPPPAEVTSGSGQADVFACRTLPPAVDLHVIERVRDRARSALEGYGALWLDTWLAADGRHLLCHFQTADTAALEPAFTGAGAAPDHWWVGRIQVLIHDVSANVLVEHQGQPYAGGAHSEELSEDVSEVASEDLSQELTGRLPEDLRDVCLVTHRVQPVRVLVSTDGRRLLTFCRAPDAESVRLAQRHGALPPGHVWAFHPLSGAY